MKQPALGKSYRLLFLLVFLNGCNSVTVKDDGSANLRAYQQRAEKLGAVTEWGLVGRISLDDGDQGGSGTLQWSIEPGASELDFYGAMGRGAWHLQVSPGRVVLTEANGDKQSAASVNTLIQSRMGWPVPVEALQWWVRGLAVPGEIENQQIDSDGLLTSLHQFGWNVEFSRYDTSGVVAMPRKLKATMEDYRVKLAIRRWHMPEDHASQQ